MALSDNKAELNEGLDELNEEFGEELKWGSRKFTVIASDGVESSEMVGGGVLQNGQVQVMVKKLAMPQPPTAGETVVFRSREWAVEGIAAESLVTWEIILTNPSR